MLTGYKTYIAAGLAALFGVLQATDWVAVISNPKASISTIGMAILMAIMRTITTTPPAAK